MQELFKILNLYTSLEENTKIALSQIVMRLEFPKGHILLEEGKVCKHLYFVKSGFLRGFSFQDGKDHTLWFAGQNDIITSLYSFISGKPCRETIQVLDPAIMFCIDYDDLQKLYLEYPELNLIGRLITEKYYLELEERAFTLQLQSAEEKYTHLLENNPNLLQQASLGQIASYLGISQETLSRIRRKK